MNVCVRGPSLVCNVFYVFLDVPDNILGKRTKPELILTLTKL